MSRLVDIDEVIKVAENTFPQEDVRKIMWVLCHTPTAYDIEKVVAELEEHRANFQCKFCKHFYDGKDECSLDCTDALIDNLIDIVRKGGVE